MPSELVRQRLQLEPRAFASEANQRRTPGIHLTEILHDIEWVRNGGKSLHAGKGYTQTDLDDFSLQGYLWENEVMTGRLRQKVRETNGAVIDIADFVKVGEIVVSIDGSYAFEITEEILALPLEMLVELCRGCIIMTPDGRAVSPDRLIEVKWTTKSAKMDPEASGDKGKQIWFRQVQGYLFGLSILLGRFVSGVEWHIQFVRGEYKGGDPPIYERWLRTYDQADVMGVWSMIVNQLMWRTGQIDGMGGGEDPHGWRQYLKGVA